LAYDLHSPRRGDIVVFEAPPGVLPPASPPGNIVRRGLRDVTRALGLAGDQSVLIKRVIALPGETVEGRNGRVYIDGQLLDEPYLSPGTLTSDFGPYRIPAGTLWVMGDNRGDSEDSRVFGAISEHAVIGRAVWRVWPPARLSFLTIAPRRM
jgi:signal peptidase I